MSKIFKMLKKFWWLIVVGLLFYYMSDPIRKAKMLQFLNNLPVIGPMIVKLFPISSSLNCNVPPISGTSTN